MIFILTKLLYTRVMIPAQGENVEPVNHEVFYGSKLCAFSVLLIIDRIILSSMCSGGSTYQAQGCGYRYILPWRRQNSCFWLKYYVRRRKRLRRLYKNKCNFLPEQIVFLYFWLVFRYKIYGILITNK